jgi:pimeloyl-ACP methyl ester carboxylesterase
MDANHRCATYGLRYGVAMTTVVFVQGACVRDQAWWWSRMTAPLAARGLATAAVDLPSCRMPDGRTAGLADDVRAVTAAIERAGDDVALVGHSYGGVVITGAGAHDAVRHLVYLTAAVPCEGESLASLTAGRPAPWMDPSDDGTVGVHADIVAELFLHDADEATRHGALERLTRQSARPFTEAPEAIAWRTTAATYVVCENDRAIPTERQRELARPLRDVTSVAAGHFPFLTAPDALADVLATVTAR